MWLIVDAIIAGFFSLSPWLLQFVGDYYGESGFLSLLRLASSSDVS